MPHHYACLIVVVIATVSFSTPITAQYPWLEQPTSQEVADIRVRAEQGDAGAQHNLGTMYSRGLGVPPDDAAAAMWYRRAAEQGHVEAQLQVGYDYRYGRGVPPDPAESVAWYRRAAEQGHVEAQLQMGYDYRYGGAVERGGVPQDLAEAVRWFRLAAEQGHVATQVILGEIYADGLGVPQDDAEAVAWYRRAVEQGNGGSRRGPSDTALIKLVRLYADGRGVPQDDVELVAWYRLAAEEGDEEGQYRLGEMYETGRGVLQDEAEAAAWYGRAAEQYRRAVERGDEEAQYRLGEMYEMGRGVLQDEAEAVALYRRAASQEHPGAQSNLERMRASGQVVPLMTALELFAELPNVQAMRIEDAWTGFGSLSSRKAHYTLERQTDGFEGTGSFSVGTWSQSAPGGQTIAEAAEDIVIPVAAVQEFLQMLGQSPLEEGRYIPVEIGTDFYPSTKIELDVETESVSFFTTSQGAGGIPWGLTFEDRTYVVYSDIPEKALDLLGPYLEHEAQAALIDQVLGR